MIYPMIVWCVIAGVLSGAFIFRAIEWLCREYRNHDNRPIHFIEIGDEKDIFYIPGDVDEYDDFEN